MATAKSLQKPRIIDITASSIRIAHPDLSNNVNTRLSSQVDAGDVSMSVYDNTGFADNDWFIVGAVADNQTEENDVDGAVTKGQSMPITNTLKFNHSIDSPVTKIYERQIKIYGAATDGGAGTLITTVSIDWKNKFTEYTLITTDTAYAYYYVEFTDGATDSDESDYIPSTGLPANSAQKLIKRALHLTNSKADPVKLTHEFLTECVNESQDATTQFMYKEPRTNEMVQMDWDFEVTTDKTTLSCVQNENEYSTASLALKYPTSEKSIINIKIGQATPLKYLPVNEFDEKMAGRPKTKVATQAEIGDTSLVVDSNIEFNDNGTLILGSDTLTYTGKSGTNTFTGIPASGSGSITAQRVVDSSVWQSVSSGLPEKYTVDGTNIKFNRPIDSSHVGYPIIVRMYKALTAITELSDTTEITHYNVLPLFIASRIETRKGNDKKATAFMNEFYEKTLANALAQKVPLPDRQQYYNFDDPFHAYDENGFYDDNNNNT